MGKTYLLEQSSISYNHALFRFDSILFCVLVSDWSQTSFALLIACKGILPKDKHVTNNNVPPPHTDSQNRRLFHTYHKAEYLPIDMKMSPTTMQLWNRRENHLWSSGSDLALPLHRQSSLILLKPRSAESRGIIRWQLLLYYIKTCQ